MNSERDLVVPVTVSNNTGTQDFNAWGTVCYVGIKPPTAASKYKWQVLDVDGNVRFDSDSSCESGKGRKEIYASLGNGTYTFRFYAADNGAYAARVGMVNQG